MAWVYPAVDVVQHVLPGMIDRGRGTLLFAGGLIERGDIHAHVTANEATFGRIKSLNPDDLADAAWELHTRRDRADEVFSVFD
jgi:hypothetical protein